MLGGKWAALARAAQQQLPRAPAHPCTPLPPTTQAAYVAVMDEQCYIPDVTVHVVPCISWEGWRFVREKMGKPAPATKVLHEHLLQWRAQLAAAHEEEAEVEEQEEEQEGSGAAEEEVRRTAWRTACRPRTRSSAPRSACSARATTAAACTHARNLPPCNPARAGARGAGGGGWHCRS